MNKKDKIIVAAAAGVIIAGAITLLFTTKEGKKLRKKAKDKGKEIIDELKNMEANFGCAKERQPSEGTVNP